MRRVAAERAVDAFVRDGSVVGLGHGSIVMYALEIIGMRLKDKILTVSRKGPSLINFIGARTEKPVNNSVPT
jgi:ribose 5-phosphate isomerase